jgi:hypothetical protein
VAVHRRRSLRRPAPVVRQRGEAPRGTRKLPADLEDLASGRREALKPRRRPEGRVHDGRVAGLLPGVPNHEARRVFDARLARLQQALEAEDVSALAAGLYDAEQLGLWRARNVTGFEALCENVLGLPKERGAALVAEEAAKRDEPMPVARLTDAAIALWMRCEAALLEGCPEVGVELASEAGRVVLRLDAPNERPELVAEALGALGRKARGLWDALTAERPRPPRDRDREPEPNE